MQRFSQQELDNVPELRSAREAYLKRTEHVAELCKKQWPHLYAKGGLCYVRHGEARALTIFNK